MHSDVQSLSQRVVQGLGLGTSTILVIGRGENIKSQYESSERRAPGDLCGLEMQSASGAVFHAGK